MNHITKKLTTSLLICACTVTSSSLWGAASWGTASAARVLISASNLHRFAASMQKFTNSTKDAVSITMALPWNPTGTRSIFLPSGTRAFSPIRQSKVIAVQNTVRQVFNTNGRNLRLA